LRELFLSSISISPESSNWNARNAIPATVGGVKISEYPREQWDGILGDFYENGIFGFTSKAVRPGFFSNFSNFFRLKDKYELVEEVAVYAYPLCVEKTQGIQPWRDIKPLKRDDMVVHFQPVLRVAFSDGGSYFLPTELTWIDVQGWMFPWHEYKRASDCQARCLKPRMEFEALPTLSYAVYRLIPVSLYLLSELYSRRIILAPGLNKKTVVERCLRFASEDDFTSGHLDIRMRDQVSVLRSTISMLVGVHFLDMSTSIEDF